uniref:ATP-dependent DNA ligase family profile domain-containing protein n=1 Tax=candidate division WOR-3 bacterium TaxID=2052148 RepID=A0A7C3UQE8_UNCW3
MSRLYLKGPVWLLQPIPYFGERLKGKWIVEPKIDGWRLQVIKDNKGDVFLYGRRLEKNPNWTEKLSFLIPATAFLPNGTLLDCELYSSRGRRFIPSLFSKNRKAEPLIFVFDILFFNGEFIGTRKLSERKAILFQLKIQPPLYCLPYREFQNPTLSSPEMVERKISFLPGIDFEGIILKKSSSLYLIGKEGPLATENWRKIRWR